MLKDIRAIQESYGVIGREEELKKLIVARHAGLHVLIEGPVGVGKTTLAKAVAGYYGQEFIRVDGDERFTEAKLVGHFEPPLVIEKGWSWDAFIPGPLLKSMQDGAILLLNEANRFTETTQNVLLTALDEKIISIPKLGTVKAKKDFMVIATQNPEEFIGVTILSEALKDRFVWTRLEYQPENEEIEIVKSKTGCEEKLARLCVKITRLSRIHPDIRRGASIRGGIDMAKILSKLGEHLNDIENAAIMALATKIELEETGKNIETIISDLVRHALEGEPLFFRAIAKT